MNGYGTEIYISLYFKFLMYITYYAVYSALPIYLVSDLHATKSQVGVTVAAYTIASVLIRPFSGFTLDKLVVGWCTYRLWYCIRSYLSVIWLP